MATRKQIEKNFKHGKDIYYIKEFPNFIEEHNFDVVSLKCDYEITLRDDYLVFNPSGWINNNIYYKDIYLTEAAANKALNKLKKYYAKLNKRKRR